MAVPSVTTELSAVNTLLRAIGEAPVNSLTGSLIVSATNARNVLAEESRKLQMRGWHFNMEVDYPLVPNVDNEIELPDNMIRVDLPDELYKWKYDVVRRGGKLYDKLNHTYKFYETLDAEVTWLLSFEDIPEQARQYITVRSARVFTEQELGSELLSGCTQKDEMDAMATLREVENDHGDYNIFNNYDVYDALWRR